MRGPTGSANAHSPFSRHDQGPRPGQAPSASNPYAASTLAPSLTPQFAANDWESAGLGRRWFNSFADGIGIGIFQGVAMGAFVESGSGGSGASIIALSLLPVVVYYVAFESMFGKTPGKFLTGTLVIDENGGRPSVGQVVVRTLVRFVPFEALSFLSSSRRGWHDKWAKTYVVRG